MRRVQDDEDVVPDSEPEREQRRKERARPQPTTAASSLEPDVHFESILHVTNGRMTHKPEGGQHELGTSPIHTFRACPSLPSIATIQPLRSDDSDQEDQISLMHISRFAYQPSSRYKPKPSRANPRNDDARDPGSSRYAPVAEKRKHAASKARPDDLPERQLVRLLKCIGCGLQWTSRKTAQQKRVHIEQCAKKNALTRETIKILIGKENRSSSQSQTTSSCATACGGCDENASTLLDSVVSTAPIKKTKRQQVIPTVRSLPETRETILNRARDLIGPTHPPKNGAMGDLPNKDCAEILSTQPFGKSLLAYRSTEVPNRPELLEVNRVMEEPMGTQPFGASSLGVVMGARRLVGFDDCSPPPTQQFATSKLAQAPRLGNDGSSSLKRPISPPCIGDDRVVRQRLLH